ncbi:MAG: hypothetical protein ACOX9B_05520 [Candidatus Xenobium sp.]|nr:hypothetical protein [Burkholderiales bacterium]
MKVLPWLTLLLPGFLLVGLGALAGRAGRRLREALGRDPYHREGDALAAYLPGCGALILGLGVFLLALGLYRNLIR